MRTVSSGISLIRSRRAVRNAIGVALLCGSAAPGCTRGGIEFVDLDFRRLPGNATLVAAEPVARAYWWLEDGTIHISAVRNSAGGKRISGRRRMDFSLVLPGTPAERARDYQLTDASLRCYVREGVNHARYRSLRGIAAVWLRPGGSLRVKFRLVAARQIFHVLTGWADVGQTVLAGEFRARKDAGRGEVILLRSEDSGMTRPARWNTPLDMRQRPVRVTGPPVKGVRE